MKAFNALYFRRMVDFFFEFLPQITLLMCLFGFMDTLIIVKWLKDWSANTSRAPSIITIMIDMFLNQGEVKTEEVDALIGEASTQKALCIALLLIAFISVPLMLFVKPFYLKFTMKHDHNGRRGSLGHRFSQLDEEEHKSNPSVAADDAINRSTNFKAEEEIDLDSIVELQGLSDENHGFGEIFIHQLIETIEFVLGTVSNTASYLRLWALSLAHSQLAHVFYDKLLKDLALSGDGNFIMVFLLFPVFFSFTLFVLLCMDVMECFLHTLRLHWVEFQNKFYKGNGYLFVPFSFESELRKAK
uniref:V-type proton ATPase subunit a n=1 Tax=Euplotes harpa TaxID=151035 RepID=A0A7S3NBD9_9SPIT